MNGDLLESLPPLLEPFAPLSPFADIIRCNAVATCQSTSRAQGEQARAQWLDVYERLNKMSATELPYLDRVRYAVAFGIGSQCVRMGLASGATWAELLDQDPRQRVNALYLRKVIALQIGDTDGAERCRRKAEILALQSMDRQMFTTTLVVELAAHVFCGDLAGVKQIMARIEPLAAESEGWRAYAQLAMAQFQQLRGDLEAAREAFDRCIAMTSRDATKEQRPLVAWLPAVAGRVETLVSLGRVDEARTVGKAALARCHELGIGFMSHEISRALALAEAKLDDYPGAVARLDVLIAEQRRLGVTGLHLGASYEARARIATWSGDEASFDEYAKLTAAEYRHGRGSALGARWERLMADARRAARGADLPSAERSTDTHTTVAEMVTKAFDGASSARARAEHALRLLCEDRKARVGYMYLASESGLSLAAAVGSAAAPAGLSHYVQEFFDHEIAQRGDQTAALTSEQTSGLVERSSFRDGSGTDHRPLLMESLADGVSRYAGVAVLVKADDAQRPLGGVALIAALTAQLIRSGDARTSA
jgi:tetratricopeptide (TPR) repeat protein